MRGCGVAPKTPTSCLQIHVPSHRQGEFATWLKLRILRKGDCPGHQWPGVIMGPHNSQAGGSEAEGRAEGWREI